MSMAGQLAVVGGHVATPSGLVRADVLIDGGTIVSVGTIRPDPAARLVDASGLLVAPGFVDTQVNGGYGMDLARDPDSMWVLGDRLVEDGVTSFLPTVVSSAAEVVQRALEALGSRPDGYSGAEPLGLHLEGPMLNPDRAGAHQVSLLQPASLDVCGTWTRQAGVWMVTLAPELEGALGVIEALAANGVVVSAGHSDATFEQMSAGLAAGVSHVTHLYNAMSPLRHREPGLVGFALSSGDVTAGIITDGVHSHRGAVEVAWNALGTRLALVTDAAPGRGLPPGPVTLGQTTGSVMPDGSIRTPDGTLAGSNLSMDQAVRNLVTWAECETHEALAAASSVPASAVGAHRKGAIEPGFDADLVLLDTDLNVTNTIVRGHR